MCGIFEILISEILRLSPKELMQITNYMFKLSESRGKEASGLALRFKGSVYVLKEPITSSRLVKTDKYKNLFNQTLRAEGYSESQLQAPLLILGHSRLQTNGQSEINTNSYCDITKSGKNISIAKSEISFSFNYSFCYFIHDHRSPYICDEA